jgi:ATP-dependent helicase HrpB
VLVFLPGAAEIERTAEALDAGPEVDVHTLYGALPAGAQDAALVPRPAGPAQGGDRHRHRRDQPDGRGCADRRGLGPRPQAAVRRHHRPDPAGDGPRLAGLGRPARRPAGRLGPGSRRCGCGPRSSTRPGRPYSEPEIRQADLAGLALELAVWGTDAAGLPFLDPPPRRAWTRPGDCSCRWARSTPTVLPTAAGRAMVALPLHPRLARMVLVGRGPGPARGSGACWRPCWRTGTSCGAARTSDRATSACAWRCWTIRRPATRWPTAGRCTGPGPAPATWPAASGPRRHGRRPDRGGVAAGPRLPRPHRPGPGRTGAVRPAGRDRGVGGRRPTPWPARPLLAVAEVDGRRTGRPHPPRRPAGPGPARSGGGRRDHRARPAALGRRARTTWWPGSSAPWAGCAWARSTGAPRRPAGHHRAGRPRPLDVAHRPPLDRAARSLQARVGFLHAVVGEPWPDLSDAALRRSLDHGWPPLLASATGRSDLDRLDLARVLRGSCRTRWPATSTASRPRRWTCRAGAGPGSTTPRATPATRRCWPSGSRTCSAPPPPQRWRAAGSRSSSTCSPRRPPGPGHQRPRRVLVRLVARRPQGDGRPLPQAPLAG